MQSFRDAKMQRCRASEIQREIVRTLAYADIFDYPLHSEELYRFLITSHSFSYSVFKKALSRIIANDKRINTNRSFYFLRGREGIVTLRQKREQWSEEKIVIARNTAQRLGKLPWVKMIGMTGALAMKNADKDEDIDLMIVTAKNRLWLTRLSIFLLCPILGIERRKPKDKKVKNKICFNLFLDESQLKITPENLFVAHEICQVKPLVNKDRTYEKFIWENQWTQKYLPNAVNLTRYQYNKITKKNVITTLLSCYLDFMEKIAFYIQYFYMKPKLTNEKISLHQAFFHPRDLSNKVEREYEIRLSGQIL